MATVSDESFTRTEPQNQVLVQGESSSVAVGATKNAAQKKGLEP